MLKKPKQKVGNEIFETHNQTNEREHENTTLQKIVTHNKNNKINELRKCASKTYNT